MGAASERAPLVLVVDDDPDMAVLCEMFLRGGGFKVLEAASGSEALAMARTHLPAVILLDVVLPDMDGTEVLRALQDDEVTAAIPVVVMTARFDARDQEAAWEFGAFGHLMRPFDRDRLLEVVRAALVPGKREEAERRRNTVLQHLHERDFEAWQRLEAIVESCEVAIVGTTNAEGTITSWNGAAERLFGYPAKEMTGRPIAVLAPPDHLDEISGILRRVAEGERLEHFETVGQHRDGHLVDVSLSITPIRNRSGTVTGASLVFWDLMARRRFDARIQNMVETVPDPMAIIDKDGNIELVNRHVVRLFGYARAEIVGQSIEKLIPLWLQARQRRLPGPDPDVSAAPASDTEPALYGLGKDGRTFPVEISLTQLQGDGLTVAVTMRDVTERKRTEAQFRGLLESAPDAIVIVDVDGRIQLVNAQAERLFGYDQTELRGQPVETLLPARFRSREAQYRDASTGKLSIRAWDVGADLYGSRKDGTEFPMEISLSPHTTPQGLLISVAVRDITERKTLEDASVAALEREREASERLRELDRLRTEFLSTVSHELRTPLSAIKGFVGILETDWTQVPEAEKIQLLGRISRASKRLDSLMSDLLEFSRFQRGQLAIKLEPQPLAELVAGVLERAAPMFETHKVHATVPEDLAVMADRVAFSRVLDNLLSNAAKFSPPGSDITVSAHLDADGVAVSVTDHGPGIPPDEIPKVFDRFYRISASSRARPGTGIGLAIVKEATEAQGGHVEVTSTEGVGSTFTIHLPSAGP